MAEDRDDSPRRLRADAERNRARVIAAARELLSERGLEVSVTEIAERAGVGRGTLFRNFPTKEDLVAATVVQALREVTARGRVLLQASDADREDAGEVLFEFVGSLVAGHHADRALFEAIGDAFLSDERFRAAYSELTHTLEALLANAQATGAVRSDIGTLDMMMMVKGVCLAAEAFQGMEDDVTMRALDLVRCAMSPAAAGRRLRGRSLTLADYACAAGGEPAAHETGPSPQPVSRPATG